MVTQEEINLNSTLLLRYDSQQTYQTMDHFGASGAWSLDPIGSEWPEEGKRQIADLLFSRITGIGLSGWRFNIGGGSAYTDRSVIRDENQWRRSGSFRPASDLDYDWTSHAGQRWFLQAAKRHGVERLVAFVNSPPGWMTKNGHAQADPSVGTTNLKTGWEPAFAAYLADIVRHFRDEEGISFHSISPVNEPSWSWDNSQQEGNRYSNDDIRRVAITLAAELRRQQLNLEIDVPEAAEIPYLLDDAAAAQLFGNSQTCYFGHDNARKYGGSYREFIRYWLGDPVTRSLTGERICGHSYFWDTVKPDEDRLIGPRKLLREALDRVAPGASYWQTEYCILGPYGPGRDLGITPALWTARVIHADLTIANASAWNWWLAVSPYDYKDGLIYTDYRHPGDNENVLPSKTLWALGHFSRFVRPGAKRIAAEFAGVDNGVDVWASAFEQCTEGERQLIFVLVNSGDEDVDVRLAASNDQGTGRKVRRFTPYLTTEAPDVNLQVGSLMPSSGTFRVPGRALATLIGTVES